MDGNDRLNMEIFEESFNIYNGSEAIAVLIGRQFKDTTCRTDMSNIPFLNIPSSIQRFNLFNYFPRPERPTPTGSPRSQAQRRLALMLIAKKHNFSPCPDKSLDASFRKLSGASIGLCLMILQEDVEFTESIIQTRCRPLVEVKSGSE